MLIIRPPREDDSAQWFPLWRAYCSFYETDVPEAVSQTTWARILDPGTPDLGAFVICAGENGPLKGFATWVRHFATWSKAKRWYLEDLYVAPECRGQGAGRALIEAVLDAAKADGSERLYWMTKADNTQARLLYDKLAVESGFVRYDVDIMPEL